MEDLATLRFSLWLFTILLIGRVVGQLIVVLDAPTVIRLTERLAM